MIAHRTVGRVAMRLPMAIALLALPAGRAARMAPATAPWHHRPGSPPARMRMVTGCR